MRRSFEGKEEGTNQRQHVRLSRYADSIIKQDMEVWNIDKMATMVNRIFEFYREDTSAAVTYTVKNYRETLEKLFRQGRGDAGKEDLSVQEKEMLDHIAAGYQQNLIAQNSSYPKDVTYKIRINNDNYDYLYGNNEWADSSYYRSPGAFIKTMLEDYARKTGPERERIFFRDCSEIIQQDLALPDEEKCVLHIKYRTGKGKTIVLNAKPYLLTEDPESMFCYVIVFSSPADAEKAGYHPAVLRLSRIISVRKRSRSFGSGKITHKEKELIDSLIEKRGIQFLLQENEAFTIRLTPHGMNMYESILHLRPVDEKEKRTVDDAGNTILHFVCPPAQIQYYFFRFGKEALILSPEHTRLSFSNQYQEAWQEYSI